MNTILRLLNCLLGVASPSRTMLILHGDTTCGPSWLDRWERRINEDAARRFVPVMFREEVKVYELDATGHSVGILLLTIDVTGRSKRAQRRVLNRWKRRCKAGALPAVVRLETLFA